MMTAYSIDIVDALVEPECVLWDFAHFEAPQQLHALWQALYAFEAKEGRRPEPRNEDDAKTLASYLSQYTKEEIPDEWTRNFAFSVSNIIGYIKHVSYCRHVAICSLSHR